MRPTDEQIKEEAEKYIASCPEFDPEMTTIRLIDFAKKLFKETEEETFDRLCNDTSNKDKSGLEMAILYHKERARIENE